MDAVTSPPPVELSSTPPVTSDSPRLPSLDSTSDFARAVEAYKAPKDATKVIVRFKATGNAPILKQQLYKITAANKFQAIIAFLRKELNWKQSDPLFLYINASFSPTPDDTVANLHKCFAVDKQLIVNYSTTAAYG